MEMEMEAFQTCWKEESLNFRKEEFYESIRAPKWLDFTLPHPQEEPDDIAWFCIQAGCDQKHGTLSPMYGKSSIRPRSRAPQSAPTLKGKHNMSGKAKPLVMSASKYRQKQCEENKDPNLTNIGSLRWKTEATDAKAINADDMDTLQYSPQHELTKKEISSTSDINLTPQDQKIKATGAFSTPRIKKNSTVKPEPFRSNPAPSKGLKTTARSKAVAAKCISFQTPTKSVKKTPSKERTPITKHSDNMKKCVQFDKARYVPGHVCTSSKCAANDHKYFSPAKLSPKKCYSALNLLPDESTLSRARNLPSSSRSKDSRTVAKHALSSGRRVLFPEQGNGQETLPRAPVQKMDLIQAKVGSFLANDTPEHCMKCLAGNIYKEQSSQISERDIKEKCEEQQDAIFASVDVRKCGSDLIKIQSENDILQGVENNRDRNICGDGRLIMNPLSMSHRQNGNDERMNSGDDGKETNPKEITRRESGVEQQYATQLGTTISGEGLTYGVNGIYSHKKSESYNVDKAASVQEKIDVASEFLAGQQQCFETLPIVVFGSVAENRGLKEDTSIKIWFSSDSESKGRHVEGTASRDLNNELDVEPCDRSLKERANNVVMNSAAENRRVDEEFLNRIPFAFESDAGLQDDSGQKTDIEFLEDGENDGQTALDVKIIDRNLEKRANKVVMDSAAGNRGAKEETSTKNWFASKSEFKDRIIDKWNTSKNPKRKLGGEANVINLDDRANKVLIDSAPENRGDREESFIGFCFASESHSNPRNDSDGKVGIAVLEDGDSRDVESNNRNQEETTNNEVLHTAAENTGAREETSLKIQFASESEFKDINMGFKANRGLRNIEEKEIKALMDSAAENRGAVKLQNLKDEIASLEDGEYDGRSAFHGEINDRNLEESANKVVMDSAAENREAREDASIKVRFPSESESNEINIKGKENTDMKSELDMEPNARYLEERGNKVAMHSIKIQFASEAESNLQNDLDGKAQIASLEDGENDGQSALHVEPIGTNLEERSNKVEIDPVAENSGPKQETPINICPTSESESKGKNIEGKESRGLKSYIDMETDNTSIEERPVEVQMYSDAENERSVQRVQLSYEAEQEPAIESASKGKAWEVLQLDTDSEALSKISHEGNSMEHFQVTMDVAIQNAKEENRDSTQEINTVDSATEYGENAQVCCASDDFTQGLREADNHSTEAGQKKCNELKVSTVEVVVGNEEIKCDVWDRPHQLASVQSKDSESDGAAKVAGFIASSVMPDTRGDESGSPFTSSKGKKRSSSEMIPKTNCSQGELCQDESCGNKAYLVQPDKANVKSTPHASKHKKIKPTLPRPFRLRTEERADLYKKAQQAAAAEKKSPPPEKQSGIGVSKRGKHVPDGRGGPRPKHKPKPRIIELPKPEKAKQMDVKEREIKNRYGERSNKKLTTTRGPVFHELHTRKDCTKAVTSPDKLAVGSQGK